MEWYVSSLFTAGKIDEKYSQKALVILNTLVEKLYVNNTLYHQRLLNEKPKVKALLEDYAFLTQALLKAYNYSLRKDYLSLAKKLTSEAIKRFYRDNTWYMSDDEFESLAEVYDSVYRSSLSQMTENLLKVTALSDDLKTQEIAKKIFEKESYLLKNKSTNLSWLFRNYIAYKKEFVIIKSSKENLLKNSTVNLPFTLKKVEDTNKYLACKIGVCFDYDDNFDTLVRKVKSVQDF